MTRHGAYCWVVCAIRIQPSDSDDRDARVPPLLLSYVWYPHMTQQKQ